MRSFINDENASSLCAKNETQMNLEKSSTIISPHFLPPKLVVLVGPNKSKCNNSMGLEVDTKFFDLNDFLVCLPNWQLQILSSSKLIYEISSTKLFLINLSIK